MFCLQRVLQQEPSPLFWDSADPHVFPPSGTVKRHKLDLEQKIKQKLTPSLSNESGMRKASISSCGSHPESLPDDETMADAASMETTGVTEETPAPPQPVVVAAGAAPCINVIKATPDREVCLPGTKNS